MASEPYARGADGTIYKTRADYLRGRGTKSKSAQQRNRRVYRNLKNIR